MNSPLTSDLNPWEEQALKHLHHRHAVHPPKPQTFDSLIYPGLYSPSGLDILTLLATIHRRPNPQIALGPVDLSCAIIICDLLQPDTPIVYATAPFFTLTGYTRAEVLGRNCRFLQQPPPSILSKGAKGRGGEKVVGGHDDGDKKREIMRRAVQGNAEVQVEVVNYKKDGQGFVNLLTIIPVRFGSDQFNYSVGFLCEMEG